MGSVENIENQASSVDKKPSRTIVIRNFPASVAKDEIDQLLVKFGTVKKCKQVSVKVTVKVGEEKELETGGSGEGPREREESRMETYMNVTYETPEMALQAMEQLSDYELHGVRLNVDYQNHGSGRSPPGTRGPGARGSGPRNNGPRNNEPGRQFSTSIPLRMLVPGEIVGAVIGRKGQVIRNITTTCKARVDVHGKDNSGLIEKVISIFGQPENCSNACKEILKIVQQEITAAAAGAIPNNKNFVVLRMLVEDRYCGRIIGKEGRSIKKIRDDTDTKISVSNSEDVAYLYPDHVITIRGTSVDNLVKAQAAISSRLAECIEKDASQANLHPGAPHGIVGPGGVMLPPMMSAGPYQGYSAVPLGPYSAPNNSRNARNMYQGQMYGNGGPVETAVGGPRGRSSGEMCQITVPNSAVGAIIGSGGSIIKQIMQDSGARISVETKKGEEADNPSNERVVVIKGSTDACWKASYYIFEKMKLDNANPNSPNAGGVPAGEHIKLKTAIKIPRVTVGRIIGKSGKNVREIQRMTGAIIRLPEDPSDQGEEVLVEILGTFMATQGAQNRVRALVQQTLSNPMDGEQRPPRGVGEGPRRPQPIESH